MSGTHVTVSAAWLAQRVRETAHGIRKIPVGWFGPDRVAAHLDRLADELAMVPTYPPPLSPMTAPSSSPIAAPPSPAWELADAILETKMALERQPMEPSATDALEVLSTRIRTGSIPVRSMVEEPGWSSDDGLHCTRLCPLHSDGGATTHSHGGGRISWT